jgi:O-antigen/teichoic acid export membrane protein
MQRKFLNNLLLMVLLNLLIKPLAIFGIDAAVQNRVGTVEYGLYFSLLNFTYFFNIILDLGITNYNTKYVAQHPHLVKRYMGKIIPLRILLFLVYVLLSVGLAYALHYEGRQFIFIGVLIFNQFLMSIIQYLRSYFAGLLLFKIDMLFSVLDKLLLILIAGYFLYSPQFQSDFKLSWFVGAQTLSYVFSVFIALIFVLWKIGLPKLAWSMPFNKVILRHSFPYAILILLMMLYNRIDAVMIERLHPMGAQEAGIYAQAFRILDAFVMFGMLFTNLLFPIFSRLIKEKTAIGPLLDSASRLLFSFALIAVVLCFAFPGQILGLIYTQQSAGTILTFQWIMLSFLPICMIMLFGTLLTANGSLKTLNYLSLFGLIINILLNFIFIQYWGAWGASLATLITQGSLAIFQFYYAQSYFSLTFNWNKIFRYLGLIGWLITTALLLQNVKNPTYSLSIFCFSAVIAVLVLDLLQWRILLGSIQSKEK